MEIVRFLIVAVVLAFGVSVVATFPPTPAVAGCSNGGGC